MPAAAALEKITSDLGLMERALTFPGGDIRAGTIAKAIEMLRREAESRPSLAELGELLHSLIEEAKEFDGIPARGDTGGAVRVMNLHRAKGLEAPVVFLADPTGNMTRAPSLHIDRSGERPAGYLEITSARGRYGKAVLAHHPDWPELGDEERLFHVAEAIRLLYVAATRAGSTLVVTRRSKGDHRSRWHFFAPHVEGINPLPDPGPRKSPEQTAFSLKVSQVHEAASAIDGRWRTVLREQYGLKAMKKIDFPPSELHRRPTRSEHGMEWGTVIHFLLETAMRRPDASLREIAAAALLEQDLPTTLASHAVETVTSVLSSEIWLRARRSSRVLVEVPLASCTAPSPEGRGWGVLQRGVIDLVFREGGGWVIVDYKTDTVEVGGLRNFAERYRSQVEEYARSWEEVSGEAVLEKGLFFTSPGRYVPL
jgi:ATP-dependent helicase/nuclease subunit A